MVVGLPFVESNTYIHTHTQEPTAAGLSSTNSSDSIDAAAADDTATTAPPTPGPTVPTGPPVVILISHTAEPGSAGSSALAAAAAALQGGQGPPPPSSSSQQQGGGASATTVHGSSRRKGLRKVIEGLRRFGPIYLVEGDASTEEGLVYVLCAAVSTVSGLALGASKARVRKHRTYPCPNTYTYIFGPRSKAGLERARACVMLADKTSTKLVGALNCMRSGVLDSERDRQIPSPQPTYT